MQWNVNNVLFHQLVTQIFRFPESNRKMIFSARFFVYVHTLHMFTSIRIQILCCYSVIDYWASRLAHKMKEIMFLINSKFNKNYAWRYNYFKKTGKVCMIFLKHRKLLTVQQTQTKGWLRPKIQSYNFRI